MYCILVSLHDGSYSVAAGVEQIERQADVVRLSFSSEKVIYLGVSHVTRDYQPIMFLFES
jgi:hypothetical protein